MTTTNVKMILAIDKKGGIGSNASENGMAWHDKEELKIFKQKTQKCIVICGSKTASLLPPLLNRTIFCISKRMRNECHQFKYNFVWLFNDIEHAINEAKELCNRKIFDGIYVVGGKSIYETCLQHNLIDEVHLSIMKHDYDCDVKIDINLFKNFTIDTIDESHETFTHYTLQKYKTDEWQYLELLNKVLASGNKRETRNGTTYSIFGHSLMFDLRNGFPLLTTKKMFERGIIEELLFFLRGDTDTKLLESKNVNIWKMNTDRHFLDTHGFESRKEGMMGPMYGYQWRHYNAEYDETTGKPKEETNTGIDQLKQAIETIKTDKHSRRILMTDYNPLQINLGVLPPCHSIIVQFYVETTNGVDYIDMTCYNRSQDLFLGTPFNVASSALLLHIVAKLTNTIPRNMHLFLGDVHIYEEHLECVKTQLVRMPYKMPQLHINKEITSIDDINTLTTSDFKITDYNCHNAIKTQMKA
jgi:thymidylate synthase